MTASEEVDFHDNLPYCDVIDEEHRMAVFGAAKLAMTRAVELETINDPIISLASNPDH